MPNTLGEGGVIAALLAVATALGAFGREIVGWLKGWRAERRADTASEADVFAKMRAEVAEMLVMSERQCEQRLQIIAAEIRLKFAEERGQLEHRIGQLEAALLAVAAGKRLDPKGQALLDEIKAREPADA